MLNLICQLRKATQVQDRMSCSHIGDIARLQPPKLSQSVHREECTQCFDNQVRDPPLVA